MKYAEFESIISPERMRKYNVACGGNTAKAMTLYRYNLRLSQEMFVVVSCFEVAKICLLLKNGIYLRCLVPVAPDSSSYRVWFFK